MKDYQLQLTLERGKWSIIGSDAAFDGLDRMAFDRGLPLRYCWCGN